MCKICESAAMVVEAAEALTRACATAAGLPIGQAPGSRRMSKAFRVIPPPTEDMIALLAKLR